MADNLALTLNSEEQNEVYERFPLLAGRRELQSGRLSGGEQQMLALAPMVVHHPAIFIADEPTLGLAPLMAEEIIRLLGELRELGSGLILIEEQPQELVGLVDDFLLMRNGEVALQGPIGSYSQDEALAAYFGGRV